MPAVNDVGEPGAREPHARFDGRELETERLVRVTEVGQPDGKPRASRLLDLPPKPRHRASSRPYTAVGAGHLFACGGFLGGLGHRSSTPQWWAHGRSATIVVIHLVMVSTRAVVSALVCGQSGPVLSVETSCGAAPTGVVK